MKGNKIIGILWLLLAAFCLYILISKLNRTPNIKFFSFANPKLLETKTFTKEEIKNLDIKLISEGLEISTSDDNTVYVELYCQQDSKPTVKLNNNTLSIESIKNVSKIMEYRKVVVKLPADIKINETNTSLTSGSLHINNLSCNELNIKNSSGSVRLNYVTTQNTNIINTSGSIHFDDCTLNNVSAKTTSGSIHISGNYEMVNLNSTSGSIHGDFYKALSKDSSFAASSGSIHVNFPSDANFKSIYNVSSGTYRNSITGTSGKTGNEQVNKDGPVLNFRTSSGSISIN